jgi:hypothetical protein
VFKVVEVTSDSKIEAPSISNLTKVNNEFKCTCYQHVQQELETASLELKTAKKIIELLQLELLLYCTEHHCKHTR